MGKNSEVEDILIGSYDLHVHANPDTEERRMDALDTARAAYESQMSGFVLKSHDYPTAPLADLLNRIYPGLKVKGAIILNKEVGGINPFAVKMAAKLGTKIVFMPTFLGQHREREDIATPNISMLDENGDLTSATLEVIKIISDYNMILASGQMPSFKVMKLFTEARKRGIEKFIVSHPYQLMTIQEQQNLASMGAYIEYSLLEYMTNDNITGANLVHILRTIGIDKCLVTTDFGQWMNPTPSEGMRMVISLLLSNGMNSEEITKLVKTNPKFLISD